MKKKIILFSMVTTNILYSQVINSIEYNNLNKISPKIINEILDMKKGDNLDEEKLNQAIKKFYKFGYFDDLVVNINKSGKLVFDFKEKPSISNLEINGYKSREDDILALKNTLGIKKGSMFTQKRVENAKKILLNALEQEGYINSVVEIETEKLNEHSMSVVFNVNKGDEIIIKKANYYGSYKLSSDDFDYVSANKEKEIASWWFGQNDGAVKIDQLKFDARRINELYFEKGYLDANVKEPFLNIDFASNQATLDMFIKEGNKYKTNDIKIYLDSSIVDPKIIYPELKLIIGNTFNIKRLRKDSEYIRTQVANKGYAFTKVKFDIKKDPKKSKVDVVFHVVPGKKVYVNDVKISGNIRTLDRVVRRNIYLAPGDLYNLTDLNDSKSKLKRSRFFDSVKIEEKRVSEDKIDIIVNVVEAATGSLMLGGGYGSYDKLMINGSINDSNIFGSGLSLGLSADLSSRKSKYSLSLKNPALNDGKYNGEIEVHNSESEYNRTNYDLYKNAKGFSAGLGKQIIRNLYGGLKYRLDFIEEDYDYSSTTYTGAQASDTDYISSSITPYLNFNNTDDFYIPREGFKIGTSLEYAGIGGDSKYIKSSSYFKYFYSIEDLTELDWIFRFKTQIKVLIDNGQINQGDSLYLGGPTTLRGYKSYAFGPEDAVIDNPYKRMFANSIEMSFPLVPSAKMRWALFYDFGMIGENDFSEITRSGTGALFEWISPVGPLQLIFSKAINAKESDDTSSFEFSLGTSF